MSGGKEDRFYSFDTLVQTQTFTIVPQRHYPHRMVPKKWPDEALIGKAMARGWAVPCRYYPVIRGRGRFYRTFVYPGVSDEVMRAIRRVMEVKRGD